MGQVLTRADVVAVLRGVAWSALGGADTGTPEGRAYVQGFVRALEATALALGYGARSDRVIIELPDNLKLGDSR